jgi:transcriptional regulator with XRE-family HTH domain
VRKLSRQAQLSQEELAFNAGLVRTYISQIERVVGNPSLIVLCKLPVVLDADMANLLVDEQAAQ